MIRTKKMDTRTKIVEKAIELFKEKDYESVSVKDICDAAGVTRNTFYYYFDSKELLFDAIGDWISRTAKQRLNDAIIEFPSYYNQVWEAYRLYLVTEIEMGPEIMNHVCFSRTCKGRADYYSYIDNVLASKMVKLIGLAQKEGQIQNPAPAEDLLWTSYAILRGTNIKWCFQWGECDLIAETAQALNSLFLPADGYEIKVDG